MDADLAGLTAQAIADGVNEGRWTAEAVVRASLERYTAVEADLHAWAALDPDNALAQARAIDALDARLPLKGVPVGIKDIFATADLPTGYGSPIYRGRREAADAACVALARAAGAIVLGKTATTEFAANSPAKTRNPCALDRSPGGSSSGSAAAVAAGLVPLANGTQTAGSVLRPASYCGVVGYKPSFGLLPCAGLKLTAPSLDTAGVFARTVDDAALLADVSGGRAPTSGAPMSGPRTSGVPTSGAEKEAAPRFGLSRSTERSAAEPETQARFEGIAQDIASAGAVVRDVALPEEFDRLADAQWTVMIREIRQSLSHERLNHPERISRNLWAIFDLAETLSEAAYAEAIALGRRCRARLDDLFGEADVDAFLFPSATGEAPSGLGGTGDPIMNRVWTFLHVPCVSLPIMAGPSGLPLGLQTIGRRGADRALLDVCRWIEARFPVHNALDPALARKLDALAADQDRGASRAFPSAE